MCFPFMSHLHSLALPARASVRAVQVLRAAALVFWWRNNLLKREKIASGKNKSTLAMTCD